MVSAFGSVGRAQGSFNTPRGVAIDGHGRIIVTDTQNHRVQVFSSDGQLERVFGGYGSEEGQMLKPTFATRDRSGRLLVADTQNHRVQVFSSEGAFEFSFGSQGTGAGEMQYPYSLACNQRNQIIVSDTNNHRIQVFSSEGRFEFTFGTPGIEQGQLRYPFGIACNELDQIVVADRYNHRVQVFHHNGDYALSLQGDFSNPHSVAVDPGTQRIIVSDTDRCRLQAFTYDGRFLSAFGSKGTGLGSFRWPTSVAVDQRGRVLAADLNHRVQVIPAGLWLPFEWSPVRHGLSPGSIRQVVLTITLIRSFEYWSVLSLIPNELLFEIFQYL